jgi:hypothetical protein
VVDWGGLENRCARKGTGGSNPSLSASYTPDKKPIVGWTPGVHCSIPFLRRTPFCKPFANQKFMNCANSSNLALIDGEIETASYAYAKANSRARLHVVSVDGFISAVGQFDCGLAQNGSKIGVL